MKNTQTILKKLFDLTHKNTKQEDLYRKLITEEYKEFMNEGSHTANDFKELCDLIWVCIQYANACEYDLEKGIAELIREYESKFYDKDGKYNPKFNEYGKLLKGSGFKKADFTKLI